MSDDLRNRCHNCGKIIRYASNVRQRKYCDDACKQSAYRWRASNTEGAAEFDKKIAAQIKEWDSLGYPQVLIERLLGVWRTYGTVALDEIGAILVYHELWLNTKHIEKEAGKRN